MRVSMSPTFSYTLDIQANTNLKGADSFGCTHEPAVVFIHQFLHIRIELLCFGYDTHIRFDQLRERLFL